ncbi:MAG: SEC-C domain-containing protein [Planctomycetia bacterium]|nr:MAG: SEC-C domain-containing protein [Planctomycetia bacterium]
MTWLLSEGDADILRSASSPSDVFFYRARRGWWLLLAALLLLLLLAGFVTLLVGGPDRWNVGRETSAVGVALMLMITPLYVGWLAFKFIPSRNDRIVIGLRAWTRARVDPLETELQALPDEALAERTRALRQRVAGGATLDEVRPEAYALVREASRRARAHRQFECQVIGAAVLEGGRVAEMRTGEGKTIVCYAANLMKVLAGQSVHMVTVNDYLVRRDAEFCRPIFELLGVSVGFITADMGSYGPEAEPRKAAYACDITYGTNSEFGFDHLRDNMKQRVEDQVQERLDFVVVDEVDSILIDEARTPLIISGAANDDVNKYRTADSVAQLLKRKHEQSVRDMQARIGELETNPPAHLRGEPKFRSGLVKFRSDPLTLTSDEAEMIGFTQYFVVELDRRSAHMTEHGAKAAQVELGLGSFYDARNMNWPHHIDQALRAHLCYHRDKEYVVQEDGIVIVDEFTGRLMTGRQWSDGLHQAVEAKERVTIKQQTQTLASVTLQNFFKLYGQLAGMTGTAMTEADEFLKIYRLDVVAIPTNRPIRRVDWNDKVFRTIPDKFDATVEEIHSYSRKGYPADPFSIAENLRLIKRLLSDAVSHGKADPKHPAMLEQVSAALRAWGDGDAKTDAAFEEKTRAIEAAFCELMGAELLGGRPVLVGTVSVEASEKLSQALNRRHGIEHEVLNAKNHAREAEIVKKAGQQHENPRRKGEFCGNVTIATNMAGRGTDIVLGSGIAAIGGLHVVGTERHESRRIDNQLRGRTGRQGDPGSSRFFLSLDDELLKLFMPEWVRKMMDVMGFKEGMSLDNRQLTRGIARAQRKVEERNFGIRKNLLEYDEVPDFQRKSFYEMRQRVLRGEGLSELIWEMIDSSVEDAVDRFYDRRFPALCVVEWVGQHLNVAIEPDKLDTREFDGLVEQVRELGAHDARSSIERAFGEYVDPDAEKEDWDLRGLCGWVEQFGLTITPAEAGAIEPDALRERIINAAIERIEAADLSALRLFTDPGFAREQLVAWAHNKYGVTIPAESLASATRDDAVRLISEQMRAAYRRREAEYPVGAVIEVAMARGGQNSNEIAARIADWVNLKYRLNWTFENFRGKTPRQVFEDLVAINRDYLENGKLDAEIDAAMAAHPGDAVLAWARERFGPAAVGRLDAVTGDLRETLRQCGYEMLRYELTRLERIVLLQTLDSVWKDHMYAMDLLRSGIGLRGYAERDPKVEFKREGTRLFNELLSHIRERVTDLIFKVQAAVPDDEEPRRTAYQQTRESKPEAAPVAAGAAAPASAGAQASGEAPRAVETIRRTIPKVGRNDPCPCGSGKKYKQCHGKGAA